MAKLVDGGTAPPPLFQSVAIREMKTSSLTLMVTVANTCRSCCNPPPFSIIQQCDCCSTYIQQFDYWSVKQFAGGDGFVADGGASSSGAVVAFEAPPAEGKKEEKVMVEYCDEYFG